MRALVFAAGLGTRLKPLTDNLPKALAPVAGHTLLYHVLMRLKAAGVDSFVVNIHHFADKIIDYVRTVPELASMDIRFSDERELLRDTGGGIRFAEPLLADSPEGHFLVHNVDIISDLDLEWLEEQVRPDALSTLVVSRRKTQRYLLFDGSGRLSGWTNIATGAVKTPFRNLDVSGCSMAAFSGIHVVSTEIFRTFGDIDRNPRAYPLYDAAGNVVENSQSSLGQCFPVMDYYLRAAAACPIYKVEPAHLTLIDAGKPETLKEADAFLRGVTLSL